MAFTTDILTALSITGSLKGNADTATFATNASYAVEAINSDTASLAHVATTAINAFTSSISSTASYATVAGALTGGVSATKTITKMTNTTQGGIFYIADNKLYAIKGTDAGSNVVFEQGAVSPTPGTAIGASILESYEIVFPYETGSLVDAGAYGFSAYALFDNGNLYTWGDNSNGNLGLGDIIDRAYPTFCTGGIAEVYTHESNAGGCARLGGTNLNYARLIVRKTNGKVYGAGYNGFYELGLGFTTNQTSLVELAWIGTNPISVYNIGTYKGMIMVQDSAGNIKVSGDNTNSGRLGVGSTSAVTTGTTNNAWITPNSTGVVDTTFRILDVYAGERYFTTAWQEENNIVLLLSNGTTKMIKGAGWNTYGILGDNTATQRTSPVEPVTGLSFANATKLIGTGGAAGTIHVLRSDGSVIGVGYNGEGQLGDGTITDRDQYRVVSATIDGFNTLIEGFTDATTAVDIFSFGHGFAPYNYRTSGPIIKMQDGKYYSTGRNDYGQCGTANASANLLYFTEIKIPGTFDLQHIGETITSTAVEGRQRILVGADNSMWAWGYNNQNFISSVNNTNIVVPKYYKPTTLIA